MPSQAACFCIMNHPCLLILCLAYSISRILECFRRSDHFKSNPKCKNVIVPIKNIAEQFCSEIHAGGFS